MDDPHKVTTLFDREMRDPAFRAGVEREEAEMARELRWRHWRGLAFSGLCVAVVVFVVVALVTVTMMIL